MVACTCEEEGGDGAPPSLLDGPSSSSSKTVAVKVIKNQPAYYHQVRGRGGEDVGACVMEVCGCVRMRRTRPFQSHTSLDPPFLPPPLPQARVEIGLLQFLNARCDPDDAHHIVRMTDFFLFRKHLCLVFERLGEGSGERKGAACVWGARAL